MLYTEDNKEHFLKSKVKVFIYIQYRIWLIVWIIVFACNAQSVTAAFLLAFARNTKFSICLSISPSSTSFSRQCSWMDCQKSFVNGL